MAENKKFKFISDYPDTTFFRYDHSSPYKNTIITSGWGRRSTKSVSQIQLKQLYNGLLPISNVKKKDLLKLYHDNIILEELHSYYQNLPSNITIIDRLKEPHIDED